MTAAQQMVYSDLTGSDAYPAVRHALGGIHI